MKIKSITDVITNSSTEVFIIKKEDILPEDKNKFVTFKSVEEVYALSDKWDPGKWDEDVYYLIREIYTIINYADNDFKYCINIDNLLVYYGLGTLALELKMSLTDVLKFLEPLWKDKLLESGFYSFADDECEYPDWVNNYQMTCRI